MADRRLCRRSFRLLPRHRSPRSRRALLEREQPVRVRPDRLASAGVHEHDHGREPVHAGHHPRSRRGCARDSERNSRSAASARGTLDGRTMAGGFGVNEGLARSFYVAADVVLANSVSEPFGLVGLEAMAAGGVVLTGGTGEDYAVPGPERRGARNPRSRGDHAPDRRAGLGAHQGRQAAARCASDRAPLRWSEVARMLIRRIEERARRQRLLGAES